MGTGNNGADIIGELYLRIKMEPISETIYFLRESIRILEERLTLVEERIFSEEKTSNTEDNHTKNEGE